MKRPFRPIFLAALCWMLIFLVPATRNGLFRAAQTRFQPSGIDPMGASTGEFERYAARHFPQNRDVRLTALMRRISEFKTPAEFEAAAREFPDDPFALSLILGAQIRKLRVYPRDGPLSNPNRSAAAPAPLPQGGSLRADWDAFIALARRGQNLEPNNSYFSWMQLYGLYITRRDAEAREVLKRAARQTDFNDHGRDVALSHLAVMRLVYGGPPSPRDHLTASLSTPFGTSAKFRSVARWIMEGAIADRSAARHQNALDASFDLLKLSRTLRRESYGILGSLTGSGMEQLAIQAITSPSTAFRPRRIGPTLGALQSAPNSLYSYAKSQNRPDITAFLDREWPEMGRSTKLALVVSAFEGMGTTPAQIVALTASERLRALIVRALPSILILGALFSLLSRRFRDESGANIGGFRRGAILGALWLAFAFVLDALIPFGSTQSGSDFPLAYLDGGLLSTSSSWVTIGLALAVISLAMGAAIGWQKRQVGGKRGMKSRVEGAFAAPDDGLMRFDFGWLIGLIARATMWVLLLGSLVTMVFNFNRGGMFRDDPATAGAVLMGVAFLISLVLHLGAWRTKPCRRATVRLGLRLVSQSLLGFFVASSVLYALVAFLALPLAFQTDRSFQSAVERGENQIARAKLGLK